MAKLKLDWTNVCCLLAVHAAAAFGIVYLATIRFSWPTIGLGVLWLGLCGLSITGGYHRLFAHPTYKACRALKAFYLFFGAASVQNSAYKWSADHRIHHAFTDQEEDTYNIRRGFLWAHIGWILFKEPPNRDFSHVRDLAADDLVMFQHRHYVALALLSGAALPFALGWIWGDPIGALLVAGAIRLTLQWHATFSVNSIAHMIGDRPYSTKNSARDSHLTAILTLGEGYHNFHHRFQNDYRNGCAWYQFDPTKWFVFVASKIGLCSDLKRAPDRAIEMARLEVQKENALAASRGEGAASA
jgi:stearoyl-CoA desaturase (delta-9 desaturase)